MVIIITGATSGIGKATLELLAKENTIYSLARRTFDNQGNIKYLSCDVSSYENVENCIKTIIANEGHIDVLINNAGIGTGGAMEEEPLDETKKVLDVNINGVIHCTKASLPYLRKSKGLVINISSVAGAIAIPFQTTYSLTKAAILRYSEALRLELKPLGVRVVTILPGDTKTSFTANRLKNENHSIYRERIERSISRMEHDEQTGDSPFKVAKLISKVCKKKKPKASYVVGFNYKILVGLSKHLPYSIVEKIIYHLYAK